MRYFTGISQGYHLDSNQFATHFQNLQKTSSLQEGKINQASTLIKKKAKTNKHCAKNEVFH